VSAFALPGPNGDVDVIDDDLIRELDVLARQQATEDFLHSFGEAGKQARLELYTEATPAEIYGTGANELYMQALAATAAAS